MLGPIEKTDLKPRKASASESADYKRGAPENSGEPRGSMRQLVPHGKQKSDTSNSSECDPRPRAFAEATVKLLAPQLL